QLLAALGVAHEAGDRRVHAQHDVVLAAEAAERFGVLVVHPEPAFEVDLTGREPALQESSDRRLGRFPFRDPGRPEMQTTAHETVAQRNRAGGPSDPVPTLSCMPTHPSRIDLLELDIDLRLADLWREAAGITDWTLDVVAAFMRAAYGKGYCDALTEDSPGSLCADHGYRVPARKHQAAQLNS